MKRGRPKGRSRDSRSFGPLGDLIRSKRLALGLGLLDIARACQCSVQFVSNIEHGRAPLPWEKVASLAAVLKIPVSELQSANLAIRSDFKSFIGGKKTDGKASSAVAYAAQAAKDAQLREVLSAYRDATPASRKKFCKTALQILG